MLEEIEMEQMMIRQKQLHDAELALVSTESFIENLNEHQLFEALYAESTIDNNALQTKVDDDPIIQK